MGWYDVAQICLNGHIITNMAKKHTEHTQKFCDKCGAKTITECSQCKTPIRGYFHSEVVVIGISDEELKPPKYCHNCGKPYPWTENKLKKVKELIDSQKKLKKEEKERLKEAIQNCVEEIDMDLNSSIIKNTLPKIEKTAVEMVKNILADILSEAVKKQIFPS